MRHLLDDLHQSLAAGNPIAYCRLVETRGSTPQKAGAAMLVYPGGSQSGTLGGGCVEAEVKRRALGILEDGSAEIVSFQLDSDYGWDDGLICGGRMQVLVDPIRSPDQTAYYDLLRSRIAAGAGVTEAVVFDAEKSGLPATARWMFDEQDQLIASTGSAAASGSAPEAVLEQLRPLASRPRPYAARS